MSDARYDAVVLGGGHHATIIAPYLARAGLSVIVLERTAHLGGGACSSEGPAPGFTMNHCSHWTRFYGHPAYREFGLYDEGLRYVFPEENEGMIFDDGSSLIGFSASRVVDPTTGRQERSEQNIEKTAEQIAHFPTRRRTSSCSTPTSSIGRRRFAATGSVPRRRGGPQTRSRNCWRFRGAGSSPSTSS